MRRGLKETLKYAKFRFDQEFKQINMEDFLKDFFNSPVVRAGMTPILGGFAPAVKDVKYNMLSTAVTSMDFFDPLQKSGIVVSNGYIRKAMEEFVDGIELADQLRYYCLMETPLG